MPDDDAARAAERIRTIGSLPVQETASIIREETAADVRELVEALRKVREDIMWAAGEPDRRCFSLEYLAAIDAVLAKHEGA